LKGKLHSFWARALLGGEKSGKAGVNLFHLGRETSTGDTQKNAKIGFTIVLERGRKPGIRDDGEKG